MADRSDFAHELRALLALALPLSVAQLALHSMQLVDTAIVGKTSVADLAGISIGRSLQFACMSLNLGVAIALEPLASQAIGAGEKDRAWSAYVSTAKASIALGPVTAVLAYASTWLLPRMGIEADVVDRAQQFLVGNAPAPGLFGVFLAAKTILQTQNRTVPTLVAAVVGNAINWLACNLLVRGDDFMRLGVPKLGAFGAGLASTIGTATLLAIVAVAALRHREPVPAASRVDVGKVAQLGVPIGLQLLAEIGVFSLAALLIGRFGKSAVAAHSVALGLASFAFMATIGVASATSVRVGHAIGEGRSSRKSGLLGIGLGGALQTVSAILFFAIPGPLVHVFTSDPVVLELGVRLVRIAAVFQLFDGVQGVAAGALRGAGDVRFSFVANVVSHWLIGLPIALALAFSAELGARGIWYGLTAGLVVVAVLATARFVRISRGVIARV